MYSLASFAALAGVASATQFYIADDVNTFVEDHSQVAKVDQDYSVYPVPEGKSGVIACETNCESLKARYIGDNKEQDFFMLMVGGEKDRSGLSGTVRLAELSTLPGVVVQDALESKLGYTFVVVSASSPFDLDAMQAPYPEKTVLSFSPKFVDETALPSSKQIRKEDDDVIRQIVDNLDEDRYFSLLSQLSGDLPIVVDGTTYNTVTRATTADLHNRAAEWAFNWFEERGFDVFYQSFTVRGTPTRNVVARKVGATRPNDIVVVGAHYDSISQNSNLLAPGAVDNGSGSVGVMVLAEQMRNFTFEKTIDFILFGGEEQGLFGSQHYVDTRRDRPGETVTTALTMDMIAYSNRFFGVTIEGTTNAAIQELMNVVEAGTKSWAPRLSINRSNFSFGSDHVPFQRAGIPAILLIEEDDTNYPHYHRTTDNMQQVNRDQANDIVKGLAAAAVIRAGAL